MIHVFAPSLGLVSRKAVEFLQILFEEILFELKLPLLL